MPYSLIFRYNVRSEIPSSMDAFFLLPRCFSKALIIKVFFATRIFTCLLKNNKDEIISVDSNFMQNGAFRIFRGKYVYQQDLSTNCGFYICNLKDIHTIKDVEILIYEKKN